MKISENVRMVMVTLILSRGQNVPTPIKNREEETQDSIEARRMKRVPGKKVIERTENCDASKLFEALEWVGFRVVNITHQLMADSRHRIRVEFTKFDADENSGRQLPTSRWQINRWLVGLIQEAFWATEVYDNPFFVNGNADPDGRMISIMFDGRRPLNQPDGKPVVAWRKDVNGQRTGVGPVPIEAEHRLTIEDSTIQLVPV